MVYMKWYSNDAFLVDLNKLSYGILKGLHYAYNKGLNELIHELSL